MYSHTNQNNPDKVSILFADVFGYSVLMEHAEEEVCTITNHCISLFIDNSKDYRGKVREVAGDGLMIQFDSADDALHFAIAMRRLLEQENTTLSIGEEILFRIGIHSGPVIAVPGGIRGHTINVAARIEAEVPPDRIGISEVTFRNLSSREKYKFHDQGYRSLKNIQSPIRLYLVEYTDEIDLTETPSETTVNRQVNRAPAIVISPLRCLGDDPRLEFLQQAISEEMMYQFSKRREYRLHSADFLGVGQRRANLAARLCRLFAIDYLVEGSITPNSEGVRLSLRLIYTRSGEIIDFTQMSIGRDTELEDIFTASVMLSLRASGQVENYESRETTQVLDSSRYGQYLLTRKLNKELTEDTNQKAQYLCQRLLTSGEDNADILVELAHAQHMAWRYGWGERSESMLEAAIESARAAVREDPEHARAHGELGYGLLFENEYDASFENFQIAQKLNPNDPWIMADVATARVFTGECESAIALLDRSLSLNSTVDLDWRLWSLAEAYFPLKEYESVISTIHKMRDPTEGQRLAAASHALLGDEKKAARITDRILKKQPDFSIGRWMEMQPDTDQSELEHYASGLAKAGLPN